MCRPKLIVEITMIEVKILLDDLDRGEYQIEFKNLLQLVYGVTTYMLTD